MQIQIVSEKSRNFEACRPSAVQDASAANARRRGKDGREALWAKETTYCIMGTFGIIVIAVLAAALGFAAGYIRGNSGSSKLATRLAFTEAQFNSAMDNLAEAEKAVEKAKIEGDSRLTKAVEDADRRIAEYKKEASEQMAAAKQEAAEASAREKEEANRRLEEQKAASAKLLAQQKEEAQAQLADVEKRHKDALEQQQRSFDETIAKVQAQLRSATDEMLKQRQKEFSESSNKDLGQIVIPLKETIEKMKDEMGKATLKQTEISSEMKANMENMMRQSEAAKKSADELAKAFRHGNKIQGDWGETILKELLDSQGLQEGVHYEIQAVIRDADGNAVKPESGSTLRPDVILHIDRTRDVIIDSKVSLTAFLDYANAEDEQSRQEALGRHLKSLRSHVDELAKKDYSSYICPPKERMDYVIMFVPHTGALWTALNTDTSLWRKAMEKGVFITDEQNLYAALRIISMTWTNIRQAENHEKIFALATEMMDRVGQFTKKYSTLGKTLEAAQKAYDEGMNKLKPSGQSILQTCAKLERLGAQQSRKNPLPKLGMTAGEESGDD